MSVFDLPDEPWQEQAACNDPRVDRSLFFGTHVCSEVCDDPSGCTGPRQERRRLERVTAAKAVCGTCPVLDQCLNWALGLPRQAGVAGGKTERERSRIRAARALDPDTDAA